MLRSIGAFSAQASRQSFDDDAAVRVLRVYHGGRSHAHRARERALAAAGVDVTLVVPSRWPDGGAESTLSDEPFPIIELAVGRSGDVNRHSYIDQDGLAAAFRDVAPSILDIYEEPFSLAARQWLRAAPHDLPVVMYTAQNVDKRYPPPFAQYEEAAHKRVAASYPCSRQAAAVVRGKGFSGLIEVLPLGYDAAAFHPGDQSLVDDEITLGLFGRLVPEKGVVDAVEILSRVSGSRPTRLVVVGAGPEEAAARARASALGMTDRIELLPWRPLSELADIYRRAHVVLVPSRPTTTWVEQFGRVIVEAQASGAVVAGYASGAIPEVAGDAAILTEVGAAELLGDRLAELLSDPADFTRRREQGIEQSRHRTWSDIAVRQADLYRRVADGDVPGLTRPRSPRRRREAARAEFGSTAATTTGVRPFALPLLRRGGPVADALAWFLDTGAELVSHAPRRPRARG
jgi:glycosyltransferase involved in cell wall biosynthesis